MDKGRQCEDTGRDHGQFNDSLSWTCLLVNTIAYKLTGWTPWGIENPDFTFRYVLPSEYTPLQENPTIFNPEVVATHKLYNKFIDNTKNPSKTAVFTCEN